MKILLVHSGQLSEVLAALPAVKEIKRRLPRCSVTLAVDEGQIPVISQVVFIDQLCCLGDRIDGSTFDAGLDFSGSSESSAFLLRSGVARRLGPGRRLTARAYTEPITPRRLDCRLHPAQRAWRLLTFLDPALENTALRSVLRRSDWAEALKPGLKPVLCSGAGDGQPPGWTTEQWRAVAEVLEEAALEAVAVDPQSSALDLFKHLAGAGRFAGALGPGAHLAAALELPGAVLVPPGAKTEQLPYRSSLTPLAAGRAASADLAAVLLGNPRPQLSPFPRAAISAFVICCDEERGIRRCLESVSWCDEIIVVDSGSTDGTLEICREFTPRVLERSWPGFVEQKRFALRQCRSEWVLNLDADEEVSDDLQGAILAILALPEAKRRPVRGYEISRVVHFLNRWWQRGGWYPEYRLRLLHRESADWSGTNPHERAVVAGPTARLDEPLYHYTYDGIPNQIAALNEYSTGAARELFRTGCRAGIPSMVGHGLARFLKFYLLKGGFREGRAGFIVACAEGWYAFLKYAKLWELRQMAGSPPSALEQR